MSKEQKEKDSLTDLKQVKASNDIEKPPVKPQEMIQKDTLISSLQKEHPEWERMTDYAYPVFPQNQITHYYPMKKSMHLWVFNFHLKK